jgi:hypothetical protein
MSLSLLEHLNIDLWPWSTACFARNEMANNLPELFESSTPKIQGLPTVIWPSVTDIVPGKLIKASLSSLQFSPCSPLAGLAFVPRLPRWTLAMTFHGKRARFSFTAIRYLLLSTPLQLSNYGVILQFDLWPSLAAYLLLSREQLLTICQNLQNPPLLRNHKTQQWLKNSWLQTTHLGKSLHIFSSPYFRPSSPQASQSLISCHTSLRKCTAPLHCQLRICWAQTPLNFFLPPMDQTFPQGFYWQVTSFCGPLPRKRPGYVPTDFPPSSSSTNLLAHTSLAQYSYPPSARTQHRSIINFRITSDLPNCYPLFPCLTACFDLERGACWQAIVVNRILTSKIKHLLVSKDLSTLKTQG